MSDFHLSGGFFLRFVTNITFSDQLESARPQEHIVLTISITWTSIPLTTAKLFAMPMLVEPSGKGNTLLYIIFDSRQSSTQPCDTPLIYVISLIMTYLQLSSNLDKVLEIVISSRLLNDSRLFFGSSKIVTKPEWLNHKVKEINKLFLFFRSFVRRMTL